MLQREQHLMMGLSRHYRTLFIDPPLSWVSLSLEKARGKGRTFGSRLRRIHDQLTVYTPPAFLPFGQRMPWIHRWNTRLLVSRIKELIEKFKVERYIMGLSWPLWVSVFQGLNPRFSYYDCSDDYLNYPGLRVSKKRVKEAEEKVLRSVDLVFCSAQRLKETKSRLNPNCFLIPNGVDLSFLENGKAGREVPPGLRDVKKPILGYMGTIGPWLDFDTLITFARARPDWSIVMIGPVTSSRFSSMMSGVSNLHWLGEKGYHELADYLRLFDVCLIPFRRDAFTANIYPTKFHQYLAMGKPVVSSFLPDLEPFQPWVIFYDGPKEMERAVDQSLREESEEKAVARRKVASENTWDQRVKAMVEILDRYLEKE
jgi:glycosyltransferase involved in cell wall biosynthesis